MDFQAQIQDYVVVYREFITKFGDMILTWARPEGWPVGPTANWPLVQSEAAFSIAIAYLLFVIFGSAIMSRLNPIGGLYPLKFLYNISQVMLCSYMCIEAGVRAYSENYTLIPCNKFNHSNPPIAFILYIFYLSKILDFFDTFFIIAEKKWKQLSFLHVYHHTTIFLFYWLNVNVGYDGDVYLTIVLNGLIHTVMYTYYFVSLHTKDIWWKSALTMSQMIQFGFMNAQAAWLINTVNDNMIFLIVIASVYHSGYSDYYYASKLFAGCSEESVSGRRLFHDSIVLVVLIGSSIFLVDVSSIFCLPVAVVALVTDKIRVGKWELVMVEIYELVMSFRKHLVKIFDFVTGLMVDTFSGVSGKNKQENKTYGNGTGLRHQRVVGRLLYGWGSGSKDRSSWGEVNAPLPQGYMNNLAVRIRQCFECKWVLDIAFDFGFGLGWTRIRMALVWQDSGLERKL
eukprot:gene2021-3930_t